MSHESRLQQAERTLMQAMLEVEACQHLTAMEWATVFTQCLLSVVLEEVEHLTPNIGRGNLLATMPEFRRDP